MSSSIIHVDDFRHHPRRRENVDGKNEPGTLHRFVAPRTREVSEPRTSLIRTLEMKRQKVHYEVTVWGDNAECRAIAENPKRACLLAQAGALENIASALESMSYLSLPRDIYFEDGIKNGELLEPIPELEPEIRIPIPSTCTDVRRRVIDALRETADVLKNDSSAWLLARLEFDYSDEPPEGGPFDDAA